MHFAVSGVTCPFWLPPAVAFLIALLVTPAGISGAFLLLPFQISVLGFVTPAVTPTNLIYNTVAIPGGVYRYIREHHMDWSIAWSIAAGTTPGVIAGSVIRIRYLPDARRVKLFIALVLLYLGARLLRDALSRIAKPQEGGAFDRWKLTLLALGVGLIGGICGTYGVGGGAIIAPFAMTSLRLPARTIAGPALLGTLVTSLVGLASFEVLGRTALSAGLAVRPDWTLGLLFGAGGLFGSYCGARLQKHLPERWIRLCLGLLVAGLAVSYVAQFLR
ncbi:conserved membrane hypothetical protein (dsrJOP associated) [Candidatus Sulfopaludibacter sp. SbA6]|nr:conserved membrane hypothetical protein (dsrJOP associated) [Candidatus Sulfopaludibacter sp. SbA6]